MFVGSEGFIERDANVEDAVRKVYRCVDEVKNRWVWSECSLRSTRRITVPVICNYIRVILYFSSLHRSYSVYKMLYTSYIQW